MIGPESQSQAKYNLGAPDSVRVIYIQCDVFALLRSRRLDSCQSRLQFQLQKNTHWNQWVTK